MNINNLKTTYDINSSCPPCRTVVSHDCDVNTRTVEVCFRQGVIPLAISKDCTAKAIFVERETNILINDNVPCTITDSGSVLIPVDNLHRQGRFDMGIEVTIATPDGNKIIATPFPMWITVNASILNNAEISEESKGTVPELLKEAAEALAEAKDYENLDNLPAINGHTLIGDQTSEELGINRVLLNTTTPPIYTSSSVNYAVGDVWVNNATNISYVLTRKTTNDLIWRQLGIKAYLSDSLPPRSENLNFNNLLYQAGDIWIHRTLYDSGTTKPFYSLNGLYICVGSAQQRTIPYNQYNILWYRIDSKIQSVTVNQNGTITFTNSDGSTVTTTGESVIGPQGPAGADGNDYVLTNQDKSDIADLVLAQLPTTQGVLYGD